MIASVNFSRDRIIRYLLYYIFTYCCGGSKTKQENSEENCNSYSIYQRSKKYCRRFKDIATMNMNDIMKNYSVVKN